VLKLVLNSIYGVFAQKYSPLFDIDHSASITLTGQAVAKQAPDIVLEYARGRGFAGDKKELYRYGDTDSAYFSVEPVLKTLGLNLTTDNKITDEARVVIKEIDNFLNSKITEWANTELKSVDPRFVFKQETICDVALFDAKKRYILHVIEQEGRIPKKPFKYVGVEIARSTYSKEVKELIKSVIEFVMLAQDKKQADTIFKKAHTDFCNMPVENISIRSKISDYEKYEAKIDSYGQVGKGTTLQAKSAIHYNKLLKHFKLDHIYQPIGSAVKIKYFYTLKNAFNFKSIAFMENYPRELYEQVKPDYQMMFDKIVAPPLERFYDCIGWRLPQTGKEIQTDLFDLFG
jgi:DNA polymerase elongation subunit (family B)